jgi:hypothetical protein
VNAQVRDALVAVRLIRRRLESERVPATFKIAFSHSLTTIEAALEPKKIEPDPVPAVEPPPTNRELEDAVIRCALELRRVENRLRGFNAPRDAWLREHADPLARYTEALDKLAAARGYQ